jgi:hypothetical protein
VALIQLTAAAAAAASGGGSSSMQTGGVISGVRCGPELFLALLELHKFLS